MFGVEVTVQVGEGPKQDDTTDCGLFAIATCVSLANTGVIPKKFDQSKMREHLVECFENQFNSIFMYILKVIKAVVY